MESEERIVAGIHFCNVCKNILTPNRANESVLEFRCRSCGKVDKDFTNASDQAKLVYSKTDETTFAEEARESDYLQDPTMPRVNITCPECDWN
jgi:DNA-directed RNA polymerase subunit M/transcription elongation factor TFIIS